jgi:hypothetical protein
MMQSLWISLLFIGLPGAVLAIGDLVDAGKKKGVRGRRLSNGIDHFHLFQGGGAASSTVIAFAAASPSPMTTNLTSIGPVQSGPTPSPASSPSTASANRPEQTPTSYNVSGPKSSRPTPSTSGSPPSAAAKGDYSMSKGLPVPSKQTPDDVRGSSRPSASPNGSVAAENGTLKGVKGFKQLRDSMGLLLPDNSTILPVSKSKSRGRPEANKKRLSASKAASKSRSIQAPSVSPAPSTPTTSSSTLSKPPTIASLPTGTVQAGTLLSLDPYSISYSVAFTRIPLDREIDQVANLTKVYLNGYFHGLYPSLAKFTTSLEAKKFISPVAPFVITYKSSAIFLNSSEAHSLSALETALSDAFAGSHKDTYISLLTQKLDPANEFATTSDITFQQNVTSMNVGNVMSASNPKTSSDQGSSSYAVLGASVAVAAAAIAFYAVANGSRSAKCQIQGKEPPLPQIHCLSVDTMDDSVTCATMSITQSASEQQGPDTQPTGQHVSGVHGPIASNVPFEACCNDNGAWPVSSSSEETPSSTTDGDFSNTDLPPRTAADTLNQIAPSAAPSLHQIATSAAHREPSSAQSEGALPPPDSRPKRVADLIRMFSA